MTDQLKTFYKDTVVPKLMDQFKYENIHQVPKVVKVTVNRGLGKRPKMLRLLSLPLTS